MKRGQSDIRFVCDYKAYSFCRFPERGRVVQWQGKNDLYLYYLNSTCSLLSLKLFCSRGICFFLASVFWQLGITYKGFSLRVLCWSALGVGWEQCLKFGDITGNVAMGGAYIKTPPPGKLRLLNHERVFPLFHKNHLHFHTTNTQLAPPASLLTTPDSVCESYVYWTVHHCNNWRIKDHLDETNYFISFLMCSTCFGH